MTSLTDYQAARAEVERLLSWPGADEEPDDNIRIVRVGHLRAILAGPPEPSVEEPVAWRVKDFADGWILCHTEAQARREAEGCGNLVQALYRSKTND